LAIDEERGFSTTFSPQEFVGPLGTTLRSELFAPSAYFGGLDWLLPDSTAQMHPHVVMHSVANHRLTVRIAVHGRDDDDSPTELALHPLEFAPHQTVKLDLEELRADSALVGGVAGVMLAHAGEPTDVVAELVNVDTTGDVVIYDRFRPAVLRPMEAGVIMSFNLAEEQRTAVVLTNITAQPEDVSVNLRYAEGTAVYEHQETVPPWSTTVLDIKRLRDQHIPDRRGRRLSPDLEFGSGIIMCTPGAIVASDPTFFSFHADTGARQTVFLAPEPGSGTGSCVVENPRAGDSGKPKPPKYPRGPFPIDCKINVPWGVNHKAIDVGSTNPYFGEEVDAMESGTIDTDPVFVAPGDPSKFSMVVVRTDGYLTIYGHVRLAMRLQRGDTVQAGDPIGITDDSGRFQKGLKISHVHVARLPPHRAQFEDVNELHRRLNPDDLNEGDNIGVLCR